MTTNPAHDLKPGAILQDTYRIDALLGQGGMGATFRGYNLANEHKVAIKVMTPEFAGQERAQELFKRESSLLRTVHHEAVVRYETTLKDREGRLYLIMEYVDGKPLSDYISRGARLASLDVLKLGARLAGGLKALHRLGIVHRDIAPDNILVPNDDILGAKLIDMGLASNTIGTDKSIIGDSFAGKLNYSAPEQLGLFGNKTTPATDLYALGLVLMRTAGLEVPGNGKGFGAIEDRREDIRITDPRVSPALREVLSALLRADPAERPTDLDALFRRAIAAEMDAEGNTAHDPVAPPPQDGQKVGGDRTKLYAIIAVVMLAVIGGGTAFALYGRAAATSGTSASNVDKVRGILESNEPYQTAMDLIGSGGDRNLDIALATLMKLGQDGETPTEVRIASLIAVARMYDPEGFDAERSPYDSPNPAAARRMYQKAAELGSDEADAALQRLAD